MRRVGTLASIVVPAPPGRRLMSHRASKGAMKDWAAALLAGTCHHHRHCYDNYPKSHLPFSSMRKGGSMIDAAAAASSFHQRPPRASFADGATMVVMQRRFSSGSGSGAGANPLPNSGSGTGSWWWHDFFTGVKRNWFTLSLPFVLVACYEKPDVMCTGGLLHAERWKDGLIVAMFFFAGLGMAFGDVHASLICWKAHAVIQGASFLLGPLLFVSVIVPLLRALGFPEPVQHGALFLSCIPTSIGVSLALTRMAGGDVGIAIVNSAMGNLLGIALTPMIAQFLVGASATIDVADVVKKLCVVLLVPWVTGLALRHQFAAALLPWSHRGVFREAQTVSLLTLLTHVFSNAFKKEGKSAAHHGDEHTTRIEATTTPAKLGMDYASPYMVGQLAGVMLLAQFSLMGLSFVAARTVGLPPTIAVAAALCGSQKTAAMGIPLLMLVYANEPELLPSLTLPILCYHPLQAIFGGVAASTVLRNIISGAAKSI